MQVASHVAKTLPCAKTFLEFIPGLNLLIGQGGMMTFDGIEKILTTIGVILTLVLTLSFSIFCSVEYDEMIAADLRYVNNEHFKEFVDSFESYGMVGRPPSAILMKWVAESSSLLLLALMLLVVLYLYVVNHGKRILEGRSAFAIKVWWKGITAILLFLIALMFVGLTYICYGFIVLSWIKWPDYRIYNTAPFYNTTAFEPYKRTPTDAFRDDWVSPLHSQTATSVYGMVVPFILGVVLISTCNALLSKTVESSDSQLKEEHPV
jgi:hypothetical protein